MEKIDKKKRRLTKSSSILRAILIFCLVPKFVFWLVSYRIEKKEKNTGEMIKFALSKSLNPEVKANALDDVILFFFQWIHNILDN